MTARRLLRNTTLRPSVPSYIALEGADGSGKTGLAAALAHRLRGEGKTVRTVREPGGTALGEAVRAVLLRGGEVSPWAEAALFAAARAELSEAVIAPALRRGEMVLSDRSVYSSLAYQGAGRGLGMKAVRALNSRPEIIWPHRTLLLDTDAATSLRRQTTADRIGGEGLEFMERVRDAYLALARRDRRIAVIDAGLPAEEVTRVAYAALTRRPRRSFRPSPRRSPPLPPPGLWEEMEDISLYGEWPGEIVAARLRGRADPGS